MTDVKPRTPSEPITSWWPSRYGADDQAGALNEIGPQQVLDAVAIDADGLPRGTATLDVAGIETPNARRDGHLQGRRFFDTANHPTLAFRTVSTRRTGDGIVVDGLLTICGEDCPLSLLTTLTPQDDRTVAVHATGTFDRMTSPLRGAPRWVIGATVDVVVEAVLHPVRAAR